MTYHLVEYAVFSIAQTIENDFNEITKDLLDANLYILMELCEQNFECKERLIKCNFI